MTARLLDLARSLYRTVLPKPVRQSIAPLIGRMRDKAAMARLRAGSHDGQPARSVAVLGLLSVPHGIGEGGRLAMVELARAGLGVRAIDVSSRVTGPREAALLPDLPLAEAHDAVLAHVNPELLTVALMAAAPDEIRNRRRVGYWVWELATVPRHWARAASMVHEVVAPSTFAADAIRRRIAVPVHVAPHPVALTAPPPPSIAERAAARAAFGVGAETFVALTSFSMSSNFARKNPLAAIAAFKAAFPAAADARLIVRCRDIDVFPQGFAALKRAIAAPGGQVMLMTDVSGAAGMRALYAACDIYIGLHRSEGFGLNLAEAMLAERCVIATGWSGNLDFMDGLSAALIPVRMISVEDPQGAYSSGEVWADPDHDSAVAALRRLASDDAERDLLASRGADYARARLSGGALADVFAGSASGKNDRRIA